MKTCTHFEQGSYSASCTDSADGRSRHFGKQFQECTLSCTVFTDDTNDISLLDLEVDVTKCPYIITVSDRRPVIDLTYAQVGVLFLEDGSVPPPVKVVAECPCRNESEAVLFTDVVEFYCCGHLS